MGTCLQAKEQGGELCIGKIRDNNTPRKSQLLRPPSQSLQGSWELLPPASVYFRGDSALR